MATVDELLQRLPARAVDARDALDAGVAAAYGWSADIRDAKVLLGVAGAEQRRAVSKL